jgi:uncharacterized protein YgiB involved in biofilm formation
MPKIVLGLLLIFVFASILSRCGSSTATADAVQIYPSVEACRAAHSAAECDQAFAGAQAAHDGSAPHYASQASCEDLYGVGQCVPRTGGSGGWFIPAMIGFTLGHALGGYGAPVIYQPVYVDRRGIAYTGTSQIGAYQRDCQITNNCPASGGGVYHSGGGGYVYRAGAGSGSSFWSNGGYTTRSVTVPRGGFGGSASSGGSFWGGSSGHAISGGSSVVRGGFGSSAGAHAGGLG